MIWNYRPSMNEKVILFYSNDGGSAPARSPELAENALAGTLPRDFL